MDCLMDQLKIMLTSEKKKSGNLLGEDNFSVQLNCNVSNTWKFPFGKSSKVYYKEFHVIHRVLEAFSITVG